MTLNIKPSPFISGITAYHSPMSGAPVDLFLNGNEGIGPPPDLLQAVLQTGVEAVRRYPDGVPLEEQVAAMLGLSPAEVVVTAGADDALARILRAVLSPGRQMVLPVPTFEMIERYARLTGGEVVPVPWGPEPLPVAAILEAATDRTSLIVVVSPNSPMGQVATASDLTRLSEARPDALLLVDLAYVDFADEDLTAHALRLPNAVVTRTLSKAWGLAGLRVGYAAGPEAIIAWLRAAGQPYSVSSLSLAIAAARLASGHEDVARFVGEIKKERAALLDRLLGLGVATSPSQGNFLFARFRDALFVRDALSGLGIAVRAFPGKPLLADGIRITLPGNAADFERLVHGLTSVLAPEALLLDIDDTLADVTDSYRGATIATAATFGVAVTFADITDAKAKGDANNDWELTLRLVKAGGVSASLEEVTDRFEALYQGTAAAPGLKSTEKLLCDRALLDRLRGRIRLGVVTGRPRRDAVEFLEREGIAALFDVVVTMEDGPLKPDPAPVRAALAGLGISRAWMVGDTPDDMRAARGAGVVPLGVVAPADDPGIARRALTAAGAGRVIDNLYQLEELLP